MGVIQTLWEWTDIRDRRGWVGDQNIEGDLSKLLGISMFSNKWHHYPDKTT